MDTALKRHGWLRNGNGFICLKAILKYRHGSEPAVSLFKIKPWISVPKKICDNPINNYICRNLWIKRVGGREMLKASGGNVKCLGKGEKK